MPATESRDASSPTAAAPKRFFGPLAFATLLTALAAILLGAAAVPWFLSDPARVSTLIARAAPGLQAAGHLGHPLRRRAEVDDARAGYI